MSNAIARDSYVALLSRLLGYHRCLESALAPCPGARGTLEASGSDLLVGDLRALRAPWSALQPDQPAPPLLQGRPERLGCHYVREGALFGGRVLARKLDHMSGADDAGRSFFKGLPDAPARWRAVCDDLETVQTPADRSRAAEAALATFTLFEKWMEGMEPIPTPSV